MEEIVKLRPRVVLQERERLFEDIMKSKIESNFLREENVRLKTRLAMVETELVRKDKFIDEIV